MKWDDIGRDCLFAGRALRVSGRWRSSISRCYYAVFSIVVGKLEGRVRLPKNRLTPRHEEQAHLILKRMTELYPKDRRRLANIVTRLRKARISADYNRSKPVDADDAREACLDAALAFKIVKVTHA